MRTILRKGDVISTAGARKFLTSICNVPDAHYNQQLQDYYPVNTNIDVLAFKNKDAWNNGFDPVTGILALNFGPNGVNPDPNHISKHTNKIQTGRPEARLWGMVFVSENITGNKIYEFMGVFEHYGIDQVNKRYLYRLVGNDVFEY